MKLFLYVLRDYFKYVFGVFFLCTFLFIFFDFIHRSTRYFAKYEASTEHIIKFYLYQIPFQLGQTLPIAALLGSVICMLLLSRSNEITAMRAAGMGPLRIGLPIVVGGGLLTLLAMLLGEVIVPKTSQKMYHVERVLIKGDNDTALKDGARWVRKGQRLFGYRSYDPISKTLLGIRIVETTPAFRPFQAIEAAKADYMVGQKLWRLSDIKVLNFRPDGSLLSTERVQQQDISIPLLPKDLHKEYRLPQELSTKELSTQIKRGKTAGLDTINYQIDMHIKFALYFAALVVSVIGIKFAYQSERAVESVRSILVALALGMSYWGILYGMRAVSKQGAVPPVIAAWTANVVILSLGSFQLWRSRKS